MNQNSTVNGKIQVLADIGYLLVYRIAVIAHTRNDVERAKLNIVFKLDSPATYFVIMNLS